MSDRAVCAPLESQIVFELPSALAVEEVVSARGIGRVFGSKVSYGAGFFLGARTLQFSRIGNVECVVSV